MRWFGYLIAVVILIACAIPPVFEKYYTPGNSPNWEACIAACEYGRQGLQLQRNSCNSWKRLDMATSAFIAENSCKEGDNLCLILARALKPEPTTEYGECNDKFNVENAYDVCYENCGGSVKRVCTANCNQ